VRLEIVYFILVLIFHTFYDYLILLMDCFYFLLVLILKLSLQA
jgi:hypothetical protein